MQSGRREKQDRQNRQEREEERKEKEKWWYTVEASLPLHFSFPLSFGNDFSLSPAFNWGRPTNLASNPPPTPGPPSSTTQNASCFPPLPHSPNFNILPFLYRLLLPLLFNTPSSSQMSAWHEWVAGSAIWTSPVYGLLQCVDRLKEEEASEWMSRVCVGGLTADTRRGLRRVTNSCPFWLLRWTLGEGDWIAAAHKHTHIHTKKKRKKMQRHAGTHILTCV